MTGPRWRNHSKIRRAMSKRSKNKLRELSFLDVPSNGLNWLTTWHQKVRLKWRFRCVLPSPNPIPENLLQNTTYSRLLKTRFCRETRSLSWKISLKILMWWTSKDAACHVPAGSMAMYLTVPPAMQVITPTAGLVMTCAMSASCITTVSAILQAYLNQSSRFFSFSHRERECWPLLNKYCSLRARQQRLRMCSKTWTNSSIVFIMSFIKASSSSHFTTKAYYA